MRSTVDARNPNQNRDRKARHSGPPVRENKDGEECGRSDDMSGRECVKFGAQARAIPNLLGVHRWPRPARGNFDGAPRQSRNRKRNQHRHENARPFLVSTPPRDARENKSDHKMLRPIPKSAHVAHEIAHTRVLVPRDQIVDSIIKVKRRQDDGGDNHDADQPVKNSAALHNKVPVRFAGRYFEAAREILNSDKSRARDEGRCQLRVAVFGMPPFSCCRDMERSVDRS